jgi:hypothetical protein
MVVKTCQRGARGPVVGALAVALVALWTAPAQACSCLRQSVQDALRSSSAVFEGHVLESTVDGGVVRVRLEVSRQWKGVHTETLSVTTAGNSAACGVAFAEGETYLVYANKNADDTTVSLCSRTTPIAQAEEDLVTLGIGSVTVEPKPLPEKEKPAQLPPGSGGCAGCAIGGTDSNVGALWVLLALVWVRGGRSRGLSRRRFPSRT